LLSSAKHFFGITATYIGSQIIGSKSKNTKAAMNRRTPKSAKLELSGRHLEYFFTRAV
jgi:hypothetical protein